MGNVKGVWDLYAWKTGPAWGASSSAGEFMAKVQGLWPGRQDETVALYCTTDKIDIGISIIVR